MIIILKYHKIRLVKYLPVAKNQTSFYALKLSEGWKLNPDNKSPNDWQEFVDQGFFLFSFYSKYYGVTIKHRLHRADERWI